MPLSCLFPVVHKRIVGCVLIIILILQTKTQSHALLFLQLLLLVNNYLLSFKSKCLFTYKHFQAVQHWQFICSR